jgi:hypothetical protein
MLVRPERERAAGVEEFAGGADAVGEIGFGRRAETGMVPLPPRIATSVSVRWWHGRRWSGR